LAAWSPANTIEALGSGAVVRIFGSITDTGTILASGSGARVDFNNATILGGKLQTSGAGAVIETQNGTTDLLSGCTIAAASLFEVTSNATLKLSGGTIGVGAMVETLNGGVVSVTGAVNNSGTLFASAANSLVQIASGAVVKGGVALIGDGIVDIAGSSGESVKFLSNGSGGLKIADTQSHTSAFSGSVSGFGGSGHSNNAVHRSGLGHLRSQHDQLELCLRRLPHQWNAVHLRRRHDGCCHQDGRQLFGG
jgi:hypothetical protein